MPVPKSEYLSNVWKDGIFGNSLSPKNNTITTFANNIPSIATAGRVAFVTGGAGSICSAQTRALVALGANAAIIGRNVEKTERMAADIATARPGAKVIGIGGCDVRNVRCPSCGIVFEEKMLSPPKIRLTCMYGNSHKRSSTLPSDAQTSSGASTSSCKSPSFCTTFVHRYPTDPLQPGIPD